MKLNLFLENKYTRWYYKLINNAQQRATFKGYGEEHHIIPKSLGGSNESDNLVKLTAKEHFVVHHLLTKMTTGKDLSKMWYAFHCMIHQTVTNKNRDYIITARIYDILRKEVAKIASQRSHKSKLAILKWIEDHIYNFLNLDGTYTPTHYRPMTYDPAKHLNADIKYESSLASRLKSMEIKNSTGCHDELLESIKGLVTLTVLKYIERPSQYIAYVREHNRLPMKGTTLSNWYNWVPDEDKLLVDTYIKVEGIQIISNKVIDLTGRRFGKLVVLEYAGQDCEPTSNRGAFWKCKCDCGSISNLQQLDLRISCGCTSPVWNNKYYYQKRQSTNGECT